MSADSVYAVSVGSRSIALALAVLLVPGCSCGESDDPMPPGDASTPVDDAGEDSDAGTTDAGVPTDDAGVDAGIAAWPPRCPAPVPSTPGWSAVFGDDRNQNGLQVGVDCAANVYVTGWIRGSADFGGMPLVETGGFADVFVASFDPSGAHRWSKIFGADPGEDLACSVAVDPDGNSFLAGVAAHPIDFGGGPLMADPLRDDFLASFDSDGEHRWSMLYGTTGEPASGSEVAVAPNGDIVVAGEFRGSIDVGGGSLMAVNDWDAYVFRLGSDGSHRWSRSFGGRGRQALRDVHVDPAGNIYVAGEYEGDGFDVGGTMLPFATDRDLFVASLAPDGEVRWAFAFGGSRRDSTASVTADPAGNVYLKGKFRYGIDIGGETYNTTFEGGWVASFDPTGAVRWSRFLGEVAIDFGETILFGEDGNLYVLGTFSEDSDFGGGVLASMGGAMYFASYGMDGAHRWSSAHPTGGFPIHVRGPRWSPDGAIYFTGAHAGTVDFGYGPTTTAGTNDIFVVRFVPP